jgi:hypothetical protein
MSFSDVATFWLCHFGIVTFCAGSKTGPCRRVTDEPIMANFGLLRHS